MRVRVGVRVMVRARARVRVYLANISPHLHVRAADLEDVPLALAGAHLLEDLVAHEGQDPLVRAVADEGVALARARLAVREHRAVVARQHTLEHRRAEVVVDLL